MMTTDQNLNSPQKFLFDTDFDTLTPNTVLNTPEPEPEDVVEEPEFVEEIAPTFSEAELAAAREEGRVAGREEAVADLTTALQQQLVTTLNGINAQLDQMFAAYAKDSEDHSRNAIVVATVIMRKLFPSLNTEHSMVEIENLIKDALQRTSGAPSLIVKVPQDILDEIEPKIQEMAALRGRDGKISVMGDLDMAQGDLQVEWDGGGILRDTSLLWDQIDAIIERNLGASIAELTEVPEQEPAPEPQQEVIKQDTVSENDGIVAESPTNDETNGDINDDATHEAASLEAAHPSEKEPVD